MRIDIDRIQTKTFALFSPWFILFLLLRNRSSAVAWNPGLQNREAIPDPHAATFLQDHFFLDHSFVII